jgi:hypothetical protein
MNFMCVTRRFPKSEIDGCLLTLTWNLSVKRMLPPVDMPDPDAVQVETRVDALDESE